MFQSFSTSDHGGLLAAEGEVDKISDAGQPQSAGHGQELGIPVWAEAPQPLGQVVQLVQVHALGCKNAF